MVYYQVDEGRLSIQSFDDLAKALELKLRWHFREQSSLWASYIKSKYCIATHPSLVQFHYPASPLWRRLCSIRCIVRPQVHWLIGRGECSFWYDCWLGSYPLTLYNPTAASMVPVFFYWQGTVWDGGKLQEVLPSSIVAHILLIPIYREELDLIR